GTLRLDQPSTFTGHVAGLDADDFIDVIGFDPNTATASYSGTNSSGTLTVSDATHTVANGTAATIAMQGNYLNSTFTTSSDGRGGVRGVDPPATPTPPAAPTTPTEPNAVVGTSGNDTIVGTAGNDTLTGLAGNDTFVFSPGGGHDTITDFHSGEDHIDISDFGLSEAALTALLASAGTTDTITLRARHAPAVSNLPR